MSIPAHLDPLLPATPRGSRRTLRLDAPGTTASGEGLAVTVHNISATGLLLESGEELAVGEALGIALPVAGTVRAEVVWVSGALAGCRFDAPLSPAALSAAQLQSAVATQLSLDVGRPDEPLAARLQRLRRAKGLTLAQIAARLGVSKPTVWAWEQGKARPVAARMDALAAALGVGAEDLAAGESDGGKLGQAIAKARRELSAAAGVGPERIRIFLEM